MMKRKFFFSLLGLFLLSSIFVPVYAEVYRDYRSDYRVVPVYNKTVQYLVLREKSQSSIYFKQNLGFSEDPTAFIIPFKGNNLAVETTGDFDPWNELLDKYQLSGIVYASKKVGFKLPPKIFTSANKDEFFEIVKNENFDLDSLYQNQIESWFAEGLNLLLLVANPVAESRVTWTQPVKIMLESDSLELPVGWLKKELGRITTGKGKVIYAEDFEGGKGGWEDEYQGSGANSLVTRDNAVAYEGNYSLKVTNKEGSINALTTQTIGGLIPGEHYTFSAYFKNGNMTMGHANLRVMGSGLVALASGIPLYAKESRDWQRLSITFQARSAFHFFTLMAAGEGGQYVYWDNIQIEKGTEASEFRKDLVGVTGGKATEDMTTSRVDFQVLIFGEPFSSPNPFIGETIYEFDAKKLPPPLSLKNADYLTVLQGLISPDELSLYLVINPADPASIETNKLIFRKEEERVSEGILDFFKKKALYLSAILIALLIKYIMNLFVGLSDKRERTVFPTLLYCLGWFINLASLLFLVTSLYNEATRGWSGGYFRNTQIFEASLFFSSFVVYVSSLWVVFGTTLKSLRQIIEVQIGVTLVLLIVVLSLLISDIVGFKAPPVIVPMEIEVLKNFYKFSKIPALIALILELVVLGLVFLRTKKETVPKPLI